jgi:hypothetical protein
VTHSIGCRSALATAAFVVAAALPACRGVGASAGHASDGEAPLIGDLDLHDLFGGAQADQVVADENVTVAAHAWRGPGFTLPSPRTVHLVVDGKDHTEKGFRLYVMTAEELAKFEKKQAFKDAPTFEGLKVHSLDKTDTLPAGSWCVVVYNSENTARAMVVHVRIVVSAA